MAKRLCIFPMVSAATFSRFGHKRGLHSLPVRDHTFVPRCMGVSGTCGRVERRRDCWGIGCAYVPSSQRPLASSTRKSSGGPQAPGQNTEIVFRGHGCVVGTATGDPGDHATDVCRADKVGTGVYCSGGWDSYLFTVRSYRRTADQCRSAGMGDEAALAYWPLAGTSGASTCGGCPPRCCNHIGKVAGGSGAYAARPFGRGCQPADHDWIGSGNDRMAGRSFGQPTLGIGRHPMACNWQLSAGLWNAAGRCPAALDRFAGSAMAGPIGAVA